jgi:hypothetical protein
MAMSIIDELFFRTGYREKEGELRIPFGCAVFRIFSNEGKNMSRSDN